LAGLVAAQSECDVLRFEALSDADLAAALKGISVRIPPRYLQHEPIAIELTPSGSTRPRVAHSAKAA
jgi:hypothetical protein